MIDLPLACVINLMVAYEISRDTGVQDIYLRGSYPYTHKKTNKFSKSEGRVFLSLRVPGESE